MTRSPIERERRPNRRYGHRGAPVTDLLKAQKGSHLPDGGEDEEHLHEYGTKGQQPARYGGDGRVHVPGTDVSVIDTLSKAKVPQSSVD